MLNLSQPLIVAAVTANLPTKIREAERVGADAVELRIDLYDEGEYEALEALDALENAETSLPIIATNRSRDQGGEFSGDAGDETERVKLLDSALGKDSVEAVDIELTADEKHRTKIVNKAERKGVTSIVSYHDFDATPSDEKLRDVLGRATQEGDVGKLAVMPEADEDILRLLRVTLDFDTVCTIAMGEKGTYSRVVAPLLGSKLTYGSIGEATAPG
ncbi:MAG: type I 3-dehydroquinate dehydratase, partial [Halobacteria archaeon]|nr:type I 3-dehydroquinate dehydratase [Halobacteria archaeon]